MPAEKKRSAVRKRRMRGAECRDSLGAADDAAIIADSTQVTYPCVAYGLTSAPKGRRAVIAVTLTGPTTASTIHVGSPQARESALEELRVLIATQLFELVDRDAT